MKVDEKSKVTVRQLIEGLQNMIKYNGLSLESGIDWADSIDTVKDEAHSAKNGDYHPIGTILLHINEPSGKGGTASFEPRRTSKHLN